MRVRRRRVRGPAQPRLLARWFAPPFHSPTSTTSSTIAQRMRSYLEQDSVVTCNLHRLVRDELELEVRSESALVALGVGPGKVRVLGVARDGKDLRVERRKLGELAVEREDFGLIGRARGGRGGQLPTAPCRCRKLRTGQTKATKSGAKADDGYKWQWRQGTGVRQSRRGERGRETARPSAPRSSTSVRLRHHSLQSMG